MKKLFALAALLSLAPVALADEPLPPDVEAVFCAKVVALKYSCRDELCASNRPQAKEACVAQITENAAGTTRDRIALCRQKVSNQLSKEAAEQLIACWSQSSCDARAKCPSP